MTNCKNCGAPLHGSKCEYCGTGYSVDIAYDNKVTINTGLGFVSFKELSEAISKLQIQQRTNKPII